MASRLSYTPPPHEQAYFEGLFQAVDVQRQGSIGGAQAVTFFGRSKLPMEVLKGVWTVADQPATSSLDRAKFAVAIRLIQLAQNGCKGQGPNLAAPDGAQLRPVFLEGVSGVTVPMPQPPGAGGAPPPAATNGQHHQQGQAPQNSQALVAQDPFVLLPQERSRYEDLFPQYAKDGFVHGKDAVDLFMKSGVSQDNLRRIWSMVDTPSDNRLDPLEFAMAMHLIVCVSKKNLQLPPGGLPPSLLQLKQAQQPPMQQQPTMQQQQNQQPLAAPPSMQANQGQGQGQGQFGNIPSPSRQQQPSIPSPQQQRNPYLNSEQSPRGLSPALSLNRGQPNMVNGGGPPQIQPTNSLPGPPPLASSGGVSISDAFEGLSTTSGGVASLPTLQPEQSEAPMNSFQQESHSFSMDSNQNQTVSMNGGYSATVEDAPSMPEPTPAHAAEPPKSTKALASSYNMSDSTGELQKLQGVLQKLQAENISLKAQLGNMTGEEKEIQKELNATVAEIGKLSNELTALRAQVLAAKARLLESTAELKSAKDRKSNLTDLISEAHETKDAIAEVHASIEGVTIPSNAQQQRQQEVMQQSKNFEANLFDFNASLSAGNGGLDNSIMPEPAPSQAADEQQEPASYGEPTVLSSGFDPQPDDQHQSLGMEKSMGMAPTYGMDAFDADGADSGYGQPSAQLAKPSHHRAPSSAFAQNDFVMGGQARPIESTPDGLSPVARTTSNLNDYGVDEASSASMQNLENVRKQLSRAEEVARDAQEALRQVENNSDELRQRADKAEANAKELTKTASEMKKGAFGGGKKKKQAEKEAEKCSAEASSFRQQFIASQSQVNDAKLVVDQTRAEVEKLRNKLEQYELDAAAAASMLQQQTDNEKPSQRGGFSDQKSNAPYGQGAMGGIDNDYDFGGTGGVPPLQPASAHGNQFEMYGGGGGPIGDQYGSGFGAGIMDGGGGGFDLPSPNQLPQSDDAFSNPFGS